MMIFDYKWNLMALFIISDSFDLIVLIQYLMRFLIMSCSLFHFNSTPLFVNDLAVFIDVASQTRILNRGSIPFMMVFI